MSARGPAALARRYLFAPEILRLMGLVVLVKPLGLATQILMANWFGAGHRYDAYALAFFLVTFSAQVIGNVYTAVAVPFLIRMRVRLESRELFGLQNATLLLFLLPAAAFTTLLLTGTGLVVDAIGRDLPPETRAHTIDLIRLMAVPGVLLLLGMMGKAVLNLNNRFRFAAAMPVLNAAVILLAVWLYHGRLDIRSFALGFGVSNALQAALLWGLIATRRHAAPVAPAAPPGALRELGSLCRMLALVHVFSLVYRFVDRMFAATLPAGNISSITYASTILTFGVELFAMTLVVVMFTRMSELAGEGDMRGLGGYLRDNVARVARLVAPAAVVLCATAGEIVRVLFMRGAFTPADAERTAGALALYVLGLPALVLIQMVARAFNALQRLREMIWLSLLYLAANVIGNALLIDAWGVRGLAIASTLAAYIHLAAALAVLRGYRLGLDVGGWVRAGLRYLLPAAVAWALVVPTGLAARIEGWRAGGALLDDVLVAMLKAACIFLAYAVLLLIGSRIGRARSRSE